MSIERITGTAVSPEQTFVAAAIARLERLWPALYGVPCPPAPRALVAKLFEPWGVRSIISRSAWPTDISDDHSPFEFSIAFAPKSPELRILVESQAGNDWESIRTACLRLNDSLGNLGADLRRFELIRDLFMPPGKAAQDTVFALWHTASLSSSGLRVKCYFAPKVRRVDRTYEIVEEAFRRLGLTSAWSTASAVLERLRTKHIWLICLDLENTPTARFKVYTSPEGTTPEDFEWVARFSSSYVAGEASDFCRAMTNSSGPYYLSSDVRRIPAVYLSFTRDHPTPSDITVQVPIRFCVPDDAAAKERICRYMRSRGVDSAPYERALEAMTYRPLDSGTGLNAWASLRTGTNPALVTVYLSAELYHILPRRDHLLDHDQRIRDAKMTSASYV